MNARVEPSRPALRYHGGKWKLAPWILDHLPPHRIYVEPFGGAASVLLRKPRSYAEVYNDLSDDVVNLFRVLRDPAQAEQLQAAVTLTPFARTEFDLACLKADDPVESARRLLARSFMGFGTTSACGEPTGFRSTSSRSGTTPAYDWRNFAPAVSELAERMRGVVIEKRPALQLIDQHDREDALFYVDPPYVHATRGQESGRLKNGYLFEMSDDDHRELAARLRTVCGMVVLSGYPCDLYDGDLYRDWHRVERKAMAEGARERTEVLWINAKAWAALNRRERCLFDERAAA